jgi:hypothetical protein
VAAAAIEVDGLRVVRRGNAVLDGAATLRRRTA